MTLRLIEQRIVFARDIRDYNEWKRDGKRGDTHTFIEDGVQFIFIRKTMKNGVVYFRIYKNGTLVEENAWRKINE